MRDGFVKVGGLIPRDVVAATRDAILEEHREAGDAGARDIARQVRLLELTAPCRTEAIEETVEQLVGPHFLRGMTYSPLLESLGAPPVLYRGFIPVLRDPQPGPHAFVPPEKGYHIDGIHRVTLLPENAYLVVFVYLTDVAEHGGATVVRPGSHRQVFEYWRAQETPDTRVLPDLPYAPPFPVAGQAGDTIFMHYLMVHSGSANHADHVRVGLNTSVVPDPAHPYVPRSGAPAADWTPLDRTLAP